MPVATWKRERRSLGRLLSRILSSGRAAALESDARSVKAKQHCDCGRYRRSGALLPRGSDSERSTPRAPKAQALGAGVVGRSRRRAFALAAATHVAELSGGGAAVLGYFRCSI